MEAREWKFESPYPPAGRLLIISPVTHIAACVCVLAWLPGFWGVFGDRESGSATPEESTGLLQHLLFFTIKGVPRNAPILRGRKNNPSPSIFKVSETVEGIKIQQLPKNKSCEALWHKEKVCVWGFCVCYREEKACTVHTCADHSQNAHVRLADGERQRPMITSNHRKCF